MSTKHVRTVADLVRFDAGLKIECLGCGNAQSMDGFEVARMCGTRELRELQQRLKCSRCGDKGARLTVLPRMPKRG